MPNRYLKESITTSETVNGLSAEAEVFFYRLIVKVDDFGRADARTSILLAGCFPLRVGSITHDQITAWLQELVQAGLAELYDVDGKRFLQLRSFALHNPPRAKGPKFPGPGESGKPLQLSMHASASKREHAQASESNGKQIPPYSSSYSDSSTSSLSIAQYLEAAIRSHSPAALLKPESWVRDIDLAIRIDKRTPEQLRQVIDFAHRNPDDDFWRSNLLSGKKLREKFDQLAIKAKGRGSPGVKTSPRAVQDTRYPEKR